MPGCCAVIPLVSQNDWTIRRWLWNWAAVQARKPDGYFPQLRRSSLSPTVLWMSRIRHWKTVGGNWVSWIRSRSFRSRNPIWMGFGKPWNCDRQASPCWFYFWVARWAISIPNEPRNFSVMFGNSMVPGDAFYLSTDLQKEIPRLIAAYDDSIGVTAAFNLNLIARINRELGANFDLSKFAHEARYDNKTHRIEMHLRSVVRQSVSIGDDFTIKLRRDETIWTESSYKFRCEDIAELARRTGFDCEIQWIDEEWPFAQSLLRAV